MGKGLSLLFFMTILILVGLYGIANVQIDNYLTDEISQKSKMYQQTAFLTVILEGLSLSPFFRKRNGVI